MKQRKNSFQIVAGSLAGVLCTTIIAACQVGVGVGRTVPTPPPASPTSAPTAAPTSAPTAAPTSAPTPDAPPAPPAAVGNTQIDRIGLPGVNTVMVGKNVFTMQLGVTDESGGAAQDKYNAETPGTDATNYAAAFSSALRELFNRTQEDADNLAQNVLTPDVLGIETTDITVFPNGRKLADDVIDAELKLLSGLEGATDKVDANDKAFRKTFPYLATAH